MTTSPLLEPIQIGSVTLKNRIIFPPLTTGYEERDGSIGPVSLAFYERLAKGGTSYIVVGDVAPVNTASPTPKLYDDSQIESYKALADAVHKYDAKLALQLFHPEYDVQGVGRMIVGARRAAMEAQQAKACGDMEFFSAKMAESDKITKEAYAKLHHDMLHFVSEAPVSVLKDIQNSMIECAKRAQKAGVDAIEIHGDRLVGSLCSTLLNHREDEYGGSLENRIRFGLELVKGLKEQVPGMLIEYKLPIITIKEDGSLRGKGGLLLEDALVYAKELEKAGVDMIQVAQANHTGNMGDTIPAMGTRDVCWMADAAAAIKKEVSVPIISVGRIISAENGEALLENGTADLVGYGRSLLTDPDFANKLAAGEPIRECLNCNKGCVDAIQSRQIASCILNAENGYETTRKILPGNGRKKVAVVGAGIAGLEAARVAALKGYEVDVYEKQPQIGGQILLASVPPRKSEILRSIAYYDEILPLLNVKVHLNTQADNTVLNQCDHVIVASGAKNLQIPLPGADLKNCVSAWDVLSGEKEIDDAAVVIGGGLVGVETAEYLLDSNHPVTIVEMLDKIANGESSTIMPEIQKDFADHQVKQYTNTKAVEILENGLKAVDTNTDEEIFIPAKYVIMALGSVKNSYDTSGLQVPFTFVGDAAGEKTADISHAIRSGYDAANQI
jgi:2,4-dienoyl-CoA reductase-like NADH-dependent reductase (Old Yellow Enzyme family)/thioredoxin reductase